MPETNPPERTALYRFYGTAGRLIGFGHVRGSLRGMYVRFAWEVMDLQFLRTEGFCRLPIEKIKACVSLDLDGPPRAAG